VKPKSKPKLSDQRKAGVRRKVAKARQMQNGKRKEALDIDADEATYLLQLAIEVYRDSHREEITDDLRKTTEVCRSAHPERRSSMPDDCDLKL